MLLMGKLTISTGPCSIAMFVYHRVPPILGKIHVRVLCVCFLCIKKHQKGRLQWDGCRCIVLHAQVRRYVTRLFLDDLDSTYQSCTSFFLWLFQFPSAFAHQWPQFWPFSSCKSVSQPIHGMITPFIMKMLAAPPSCAPPPPPPPPPDCKVAPKINSRLLSFLVPVWRRALKTRRANNHKHVVLILDGY